MSSTTELSRPQIAVRDFIASELASGRPSSSHREIASHFGHASSYAAGCHVRPLLQKGAFVSDPGKARSLRPADRPRAPRLAAFVETPLFGERRRHGHHEIMIEAII